MPYKLSQKGPAALIEDFDNDGIKDFFLGGAAGNQSQYFKATGNNTWKKEEKDVFSFTLVFAAIGPSFLSSTD